MEKIKILILFFALSCMCSCNAQLMQTLFSGLNVNSLGKALAKQLGDAHEMAIGQNSLEKQMDLFNNEVGRNVPQYVNPADYFKLALDRGELRYLSPLDSDALVIAGVTQLIPTNQ